MGFFWGFFLIIIVVGIIRFMDSLPLGTFVFAIGLLTLFCFLEKEHYLKKKTDLVNILIDIFKAEPVSEDVMKF